MGINNVYSESFRRNAVAVVRAGFATATTAKRLGMPEQSLKNWVHHPRHAEVQPASEEVLTALPTIPQTHSSGLVPITKTEKKFIPDGEIKFKVGKMEMSLPQNCGKDSLVTIIKALGEAGVLILIHKLTMYLPEPQT